MAQIIEYELLSGNTADLPREVTERIAAGWEPYGPPVSHGRYVLQAVVRRKSKEKRIRRTSED